MTKKCLKKDISYIKSLLLHVFSEKFKIKGVILQHFKKSIEESGFEDELNQVFFQYLSDVNVYNEVFSDFINMLKNALDCRENWWIEHVIRDFINEFSDISQGDINHKIIFLIRQSLVFGDHTDDLFEEIFGYANNYNIDIADIINGVFSSDITKD